MALIASEELVRQARRSFNGQYYYVVLLNNITASYNAQTTYSDILADEVTAGLGGYSRIGFSYDSIDVSAGINGAIVENRVATFSHNGDADDIVFTHVALVRLSDGDFYLVSIESMGDFYVIRAGSTARIDINFIYTN